MLVSLVLLFVAIAVLVRIDETDDPPSPVVPRPLAALTWATVGGAGRAVRRGHPGHGRRARTAATTRRPGSSSPVRTLAQVHADLMFLYLGLLIAMTVGYLAVRAPRTADPAGPYVLIGVTAAQGADRPGAVRHRGARGAGRRPRARRGPAHRPPPRRWRWPPGPAGTPGASPPGPVPCVGGSARPAAALPRARCGRVARSAPPRQISLAGVAAPGDVPVRPDQNDARRTEPVPLLERPVGIDEIVAATARAPASPLRPQPGHAQPAPWRPPQPRRGPSSCPSNRSCVEHSRPSTSTRGVRRAVARLRGSAGPRRRARRTS